MAVSAATERRSSLGGVGIWVPAFVRKREATALTVAAALMDRQHRVPLSRTPHR
jgi:hypothetical protein